jgi:hypothetical protein
MGSWPIRSTQAQRLSVPLSCVAIISVCACRIAVSSGRRQRAQRVSVHWLVWTRGLVIYAYRAIRFLLSVTAESASDIHVGVLPEYWSAASGVGERGLVCPVGERRFIRDRRCFAHSGPRARFVVFPASCIGKVGRRISLDFITLFAGVHRPIHFVTSPPWHSRKKVYISIQRLACESGLKGLSHALLPSVFLERLCPASRRSHPLARRPRRRFVLRVVASDRPCAHRSPCRACCYGRPRPVFRRF